MLVSQATYDLIQDQVQASPIPNLRLKGVDRAVNAYHVTQILGDRNQKAPAKDAGA